MLTAPLNVLGATSKIVAAYVGFNPLPVTEMVTLVTSVYHALDGLGNVSKVLDAPPVLTPAVRVSRSIFPDRIICLEDGLAFQMLKRHLRVTYDLSPDEYRAKWGLPADYPMTAPAYAARRSAIAKAGGLGDRSRRKRQAVSAVA